MIGIKPSAGVELYTAAAIMMIIVSTEPSYSM
jgi:hypothetical protein